MRYTARAVTGSDGSQLDIGFDLSCLSIEKGVYSTPINVFKDFTWLVDRLCLVSDMYRDEKLSLLAVNLTGAGANITDDVTTYMCKEKPKSIMVTWRNKSFVLHAGKIHRQTGEK